MAYVELAVLARHFEAVQRARISATLQFKAFERMGLSGDLLTSTPRYIKSLTRREAALKRRLANEALAGEAEPWLVAVVEYVTETIGLGPTVLYVVGLIPPLPAFSSPAKLWKYFGAHVVDGVAVRTKRGEWAGFSPELRAHALYRIVDPIVKERKSPYRSVWDERKSTTILTHPPMTEDCPSCMLAINQTAEDRAGKAYTRERKALSRDCSNVGGIHWSDGHRYLDAVRVCGKQVWRDVWRVANGTMAVTA